MLRIRYESRHFPPGSIPDGVTSLETTWDDLLWAAVTVGRPNRQYVFKHGASSAYEAIFRWSMLRMALEQSGWGSKRLRRTTAFKTLDPTEKGAINYFLGLIICKLFAEKMLDTPWLLHLDVFRPALNAVLTGRSRPDLVGQSTASGAWSAYECKGRISPPDQSVKDKAKTQAQRLLAVQGVPCTLHVGAITYFHGDVLHFYWCDPPPEKAPGIQIALEPNVWKHYYQPSFEAAVERGARPSSPESLVDVPGVDLRIGIHPIVLKYLLQDQWDRAQAAAREARGVITEDGYQPDGIRVVAGASWSQPFEE